MPIDLSNVSHHPVLEELTNILCSKTQNTDREFFRAIVAHYLGKVASNMRATVETKDRGSIPVNIYSLCLSPSGTGKGYSVNILENEILNTYRKRFTEETFQTIADAKLWDMANDRAARSGTDPEEEKDKLGKQFDAAGEFPFTFDSGTVPAVKQLREKLILAGAGAVSFAVDEIGSNLINSVELLNIYLELFDQGQVKMKLVKNTAENKRAKDLQGKTPANMMLFGTPSKLLDGHVTEQTFYSFLEAGYARRCFFAWGKPSEKAYNTMTPEEAFKQLSSQTNDVVMSQWRDYFYKLADPGYFGWKADVPDDVAIELIRYKFECERLADLLPEHEAISKAEISHRYFKALKLAGTYAFIDMSPEVTMDHLYQAILLTEESGKSFEAILTREKTYVKLARYIAEAGSDVTHADLHEALPFYKTGNSARNEMLSLATAWGYKNHIVIKKSFVDGIEFFSGESLKETNLDELRVSYSDHPAYNYVNDVAPFSQLEDLVTAPGYHFLNHYVENGHRTKENVVGGFNMLCFDVDGAIPLDVALDLLSDYTYLVYTTKSHTEEDNRFRIILPINYQVQLDEDDYKECVNSILAWLPFQCDEVSNQRSRKWRTNDQSQIFKNEGKLMDILPFIPKTSRNEDHKKAQNQLDSLTNLERWFAQRIAVGNRNNNMLKYAMALVDSGMSYGDVEANVTRFNKSLNNGLTEDELENTIFVTVAKRYNP